MLNMGDRAIWKWIDQPRKYLCNLIRNHPQKLWTDEGQRTTARLLEEARHLSTAAMEPPYATIDESMSTTLQGSETAMSDILATQDLRKLNKSETGERGPAPVEMKAGLLTGSFSPFNFEKEFQMRHGVSPEDADKPWQSYHQFRASSARSRTPDLEIESVNTEVSPSTSPTRDMETLRTPGVTRNQEYEE